MAGTGRDKRKRGKKIVVKNHYDSFQEACYLTDRIRELQKQGIPLTRSPYFTACSQSKVLEDVFSKNGIPYEVAVRRGSMKFRCWNGSCGFAVPGGPGRPRCCGFRSEQPEYGVGISAKKAEKLVEEGCAGVCGRRKLQSGSRKSQVPGLFERMVSFDRNGAEIKDTNAFYEYFDLDCSLKPNAASYGDDKANVRHFLDRMFAFMNAKDLKLSEGLREF